MNQSSKQRAFSFIELQRVDSLSPKEEKDSIQYAEQTKVVPKFFERSPFISKPLGRRQKILKKSKTGDDHNVPTLVVKPPIRGNLFPEEQEQEFQSPLIRNQTLTSQEKDQQEKQMLEDMSLRSKSKLMQEQELIDNIVHQTLSRDDEAGSKNKEKEGRKFKIFETQRTQFQDFEGSSDDEEQSLVIKPNKVITKAEAIPTSVKVKNIDFKAFIGQSLYDSKFQTIWVLFLIFSLTYNYFTCFYFLAIEGFPFDSWLFTELAVEIFMIIDFLINLFLMCKDKVSWRKMHMLRDKSDEKRVKIFFNFVSVIPSSLILFLLYQNDPFQIEDIHFNAIRIHKLLKFFDILIYFRNIEQIQKRKYRFSSISIIKIFYFLLVTSHLMTCVWLVFNRTEKADVTWFGVVGLDQASSWEIYLEAAVYVLSTMMGCGLLNQFPKNQGEEVIVMVIIIFGATLFATFFSLFVVIIHHMNEEIIEKDQKLEQALNLSEQLGLKPSLKNKIKFYYSTIRLKFDELQKKYEAIQELPESIKQEISMKVYKDFIKKVKIFECAEDSFIKDLCVNFNPEICLQSDYVVQEFEIADKIFFIMKGTVEAVAHNKTTILAVMEDGSFFGEVGVLITGIRTCSIRSKSSCLFYTISKKMIIQILKKHPLQTRVLFTIASQRYKITEDLKANTQLKLEEEGSDMKLLSPVIPNGRKDSAASVKDGPLTTQPDEAGKGENTFLEEKVKDLPYKLYLPFSRFYKIWMGIIIFVYIYNLFYVPFSIAFDSHIPKEYVIFDFLTIIANIIDIYIKASTAIDQKGQSNTSQFEIINDYINKGWFILDVFSVIPLDYFFWAAGLNQNVIAISRLLRLIKFFRIIELIVIIKKIYNIQLTKYSLIISCFIMCIFCHIIGCVFFLLGKYEYEAKNRFDHKTLFGDMSSRPFLDYGEFSEMPKHEQYIHMLYFGAQYMSQIMQGDMIPYGHIEESLGLLVLLFQKFLMSFILAQAEHYTASLHLQYSTHIKKMKEIAQWMNLKAMPKELINRVMKYEDLIWKKFKGNNMQTILHDLPETLQYETQYHLFKELIESVKIFPKDDVGALGSLIQRLRLVLYPKGEYVIMMGEIASDMYFIIHGKVHIYIQNNIKVAELGSGKYFGEIALIQETATLRNASAVCVKNSQIAVLSQHDFDIIRKKHPQFDKAIKDEVYKRQRDTQQKQEEGKSKESESVQTPLRHSKTKAHSVFVPPPVIDNGHRGSISFSRSRSKTMDYYYDSKIFVKKLLTKKNAMLIITGIFAIYNVFAYPFLIAFKWRVYDHIGILVLEILTLIIYSCQITMLVLQYKMLNKSRYLQYLTITQNTTRMFDDNEPRESEQDENQVTGSDIKIRQIDKDMKVLKRKIIFQAIAVFPMALICDLIPHSNSQIFVSLLKLLRIISYWPIFQFFKYFEKKAMSTIRIIQAIFLYYAAVHLFGCLFIHISTYEEHYDPLQTWIKRIPVRELLPQSEDSMQNVTEESMHELSTYHVYIACLEFQVSMMSHIAKGDITAVTVRERAFLVFVMVIYFYLFALIFGDVVSIISELIPVNFMRLNERYHGIMSRIQKDKLSKESVQKIREYYDVLWYKTKGIDDKFIQHLPGNIKNEIRLFQYQAAFQQCSLFYDTNGYIQLPLIKSLIQMLQVRTYQKHDFVTILGSHDQNSYFVLDGILGLYGANRQYVGFMRTGTYFSNLCSKNFGNKSLANIFSDGMSIVGVLPQEKHIILSQAYPQWYAMFQDHNLIKMNLLEVYLNEYLTSKGMVICEESQMKILEQIATNEKTEYYDKLIQDYRSCDYDAHSQQYDFLTNVEDLYYKDNIEDKRYLATKEWAALHVNNNHFNNQKFKFSPNSPIVSLLAYLHGFNLLYIAICVPIQIGYTIHFNQTFIIMEILSLAISVFYVLIKLRTSIEIQGEQNVEFKAILKYYYKNQGLIWDLFSLLPINLFLGISYSGTPHLPFDLIRLTRTFALGNIPKVYEKLQLKFRKHNYSVQLTKPILFFYIFWQWQACFWFYINAAFEADKVESWYHEKGFGGEDHEQNLSHQFAASMYLTIDQRAEIATNTLEFTIMVILINLGDVLLTVSFGLLSGITMKTIKETDAERAYNKMDDVLRYLEEYSIDEDIKKKIRNFFSYSWSLQKKSKLLVLEELDSVLPYKLSREIVYYSSRDLLLPMFGKFNSENFIKDISLYLENVIFMPDTYIVIKDEIGEEMFFIAEGSVNVLTSDRKKITLNKGAFFGEIAIFLNTKRTTFVKSASYCSIFMLKKVHIIKILKTYPSIQEQFKKEAEIRIQQIRQFQAKPQHIVPQKSQSDIQEESEQSETQRIDEENDEETESIQRNPNKLESIEEILVNDKEEKEHSSHDKAQSRNDLHLKGSQITVLNMDKLGDNLDSIYDANDQADLILLSQHSKRSSRSQRRHASGRNNEEDQNSKELLNFKQKNKRFKIKDLSCEFLPYEDSHNMSHQFDLIPNMYGIDELEKLQIRESSFKYEPKSKKR